MRGVWMRLRAEVRGGWRAHVAMALLLGVFGGVALTAAAAARRTDSVVDRLITIVNEPDVFVPQFSDGPFEPIATDVVASVPGVQALVEVRELRVFGDLPVIGSRDPRFSQSLMRAHLLGGRRADPNSPDEIVVNHLAAQRLDIEVGDTMTLEFTPPGVQSQSGSFAIERPEDAPEVFKRVPVTVVGVATTSGDLVAAAQPTAIVTPAFLRTHTDLSADTFLMVWLDRGSEGFDAFTRDLTEANGGKSAFAIPSSIDIAQVKRSFQLQSGALWFLAGAIGFATLLVFGQALARQIFLDAAESPALSALGLTRNQLVWLAMSRTALSAAGGAVFAGILAVTLSPATPIGLARIAEPEPGVRFDALAILGGAGGITLILLLLCALPAWHAARGRTPAVDGLRTRPSPFAGLVARLVRRPSAAVGARMALEGGRGATAAPVRTTLGSIAFGLAAFTAASTVASSMDHLLGTPRLYGWGWDAQIDPVGERDPLGPLSKIDEIDAIAIGADWAPLEIDGRAVVAMALEGVKGTISPTLLQGRGPLGADEIAIGRSIAQRGDHRIGDMVTVGLQGLPGERPMQIVGICIFPRVDDSSSVGEGAFITNTGMQALYPDAPTPMAFVRFRPGAEASGMVAIRATFGQENVLGATPPGTVLDFGQVSSMPMILAGVLGALAAAALAHGLATTVRRRRRDLAILRCLGFVRSQVRSAVAWQATIMTVVAFAVAMPVGIATGRWLWTAIAHSGGFVVETSVPAVAMFVAVPVALVVANAIATLPARRAARTQPAVVLRSE